MLDRDTAQEARNHILEAIRHINQSWQLLEGRMSDATFQEMKRAAGIVIGTLDYDYLCRIFDLFPELDDVGRAPATDSLGRTSRPEEPG
ncbi:hypothetical protein [Bosea sp. (in: a-proteobacteria)]|jgi:hypothetical protein|uniref:hypothetical protein n=1 Tax=Bosea sp. (in: a-proteobacteria) TaxID=1871050 RepID=UPI0035631029